MNTQPAINKEWRERRPANPETGELVMAPFGEE